MAVVKQQQSNNLDFAKVSTWLIRCLLTFTIVAANTTTAQEPPLAGQQLAIAPTHLPYKEKAKIAIIIDDIGYNRKAGEKAINLPGALTYAVIPFTPFGRSLGEQAHFSEKEVILHLPMESSVRDKLDDGGITTQQSKYEVKDTLRDSLNKLPFVVGFNNHMGSLLTTDEKAMSWIMEEVSATPLFFIDSMTNPQSIAYETANEFGVPSLRRDIFLDADPHPVKIEKAFKRLVRIAKRMGSAIAIAHPYPNTLEFLEAKLPKLHQHGVVLVNVSELISGAPTSAAARQPIWTAQAILDHLVDLPSPASQRFAID
ncbi:MAG: divergent polysaccharide deacetylase family protein [Pseudomonadales bacterium]|nr:divergent polysaccharide deacetylase family protein [Pseudomonadales bacterium]